MNSRYITMCAAALVLLHAPFGYAQETETETETETNDQVIEVVVTADRVETDLLSTAAHVSIITAEDIRESGATNLVQLLERQPGVNFRTFSNEAQASVDMRGFGEGSAARVLVLVDGRRQNNPDLSGVNWLGVPIDAIERVEVLRGSASALYGNHAVGGVINIITKTPDRPLEVTGFGSLGSFGDAFTRQGRLGILHAGDGYRVRGSAEQFETDGYRDRSAYEALNFSFSGEFDASDAVIVSFGSRYSGIEYELPGRLTKAQFKENPRQATNQEDENRENLFGIDLGVEWFIGNSVMLEIPLGYNLKLVENNFASAFTPSFTDTELETLLASPAVVVDWAAGSIPVRTRLGVDAYKAQQDGIRYNEVERETVAAEFQLTQWSLGTMLSNAVSFGNRFDLRKVLRYERSEISGENEASDVKDSKTHGALVFDLGGVYRPNDWSKLFVSGGTLYRYPALDEQAAVRGYGADAFEKDLDPEKGFTVEAGGAAYLTNLVRFDGSIYVMQLQDEIAPNENFRNVNLDETRRIGGDVQLSSEPIQQLRISAGYSYVNPVFIKGENKDNQVPLVPNHSVDAELGIRPISGFELGPAISFRSESYEGGDSANDKDKVDSYFLTNLFLRFRPAGVSGDLAISASFKNVFNERYVPYVFYGGYYPAPGRSFEIAASYRY
ncbi:MAG: TonB-dependent receptor [Spirochaetia bacterium]